MGQKFEVERFYISESRSSCLSTWHNDLAVQVYPAGHRTKTWGSEGQNQSLCYGEPAGITGKDFHKMHRERNWALCCALNGKGILHAGLSLERRQGEWVLAWYGRTDRAIIKGQGFHLPEAAYVSHLSTQAKWVGTQSHRIKDFLFSPKLSAPLHLALGLWPSSRLHIRASYCPATPLSCLSLPCAPPPLSFSQISLVLDATADIPWEQKSTACLQATGRRLLCPRQMGRRTGSWEVCLLPGEKAAALACFAAFGTMKLQFGLPVDTHRGGVIQYADIHWEDEGTSRELEFHMTL